MKAIALLPFVAFALTQVAIIPEANAATAPGGYTMEVYVGGWSTPEYHARGNTYIEAQEGREYTIRLTNPTGRRVAVAVTVDGMNSVDAKRTSARDATKWVLGPYDTVEIKGWQTSSTSSRAFYFTTEESSYGNWLGQADNLGVISAAFFPEEAPEITYYQRYEPGIEGRSGRSSNKAASGAAKSSRRPASPPEAIAGDMMSEADESMAATGIGRERHNHVTEVAMELSDRPDAVLSVRYEYRSELISLGVLPQTPKPLNRREQATGFEDVGFAPDPWRQGW